MAIVIFSFLLLISTSLLLRNRFIFKMKISFCLRKPLVPFVIWFFVMVLFVVLSVNLLGEFYRGDVFHVLVFLLLIFLTSSLSAIFSFLATKGSISNTYFTHKMTRDLHIDIKRGFIPSDSTYSEKKLYLDDFIVKISSLKDFTYKNVVFKSHLIQIPIAETIKKTLKTKAIPFTSSTYKVGFVETAKLNLWYGGKTCYRLFSHNKHSNGFRVRRMGHKFTIRLHP